MRPTTSILLTHVLLGLVVGVAAIIDARTGRIPNRLTFPALLLGPVFWLIAFGKFGLAESLAGILLCGVPPLLAFRAGGMPGGDLKLFAAIGGLVGPVMGIEIEFFSMFAAGLFGVCLLAFRGRLRETFGQAYVRLMNRMLPKKWHREEREIERMTIRIGPFAFVGSLIAIVQRLPLWVEYFDGH